MCYLENGLNDPKVVRIDEDGEVNHDESERSKTFKPPSLMPYMRPLPFPQGVVKAKIHAQFRKFLDMSMEFYENILLTGA